MTLIYKCSSLKSIEIPSSVTFIGEQAFCECSSLESIEIPSSVTTIGSKSFCGCSKLESIEIPSSVTKIGSKSFYICECLKSVTIHAQIKVIEYETFGYCKLLKQMHIPDSVEYIDSESFLNCSSLKEVVFPKKLSVISTSAFSYCDLSKVSLPSSTELSRDCFDKNVIINFYDPNEVPNDESNSHPSIQNTAVDDDECTFIHTGTRMVNQLLFTCKTCYLKQGDCICEVCARKCHAGHNVRFIGYDKGYCDCGAGNISRRCLCCNKKSEGEFVSAFIPGPCTLNRYGQKFVEQSFYKCLTCNYSSDEGCCEICAQTCHLGHDLIYLGKIPSFCDCGYGYKNCKCVKKPNPEYKKPK